ncbi:MAG: hypothetical protein Q9187_002011 [Circinaria calcarea]
MAQYIPPPDPRNLLPPLLACFPTAFASPQPPPALLPLLSPILRQRIQLLSPSPTTTSESWLPLLCWETREAERLADIVASDAFELHPVSGEIEFRDVENISYRRLDEETLQARVCIPDLSLVVIYLWCEGDAAGGGSGWRVSEVSPTDPNSEIPRHSWLRSISEADENAKTAMTTEMLGQEECATQQTPSNQNPDENEDGDDDYWAQYDTTPARTPAKPHSPTIAGNSNHSGRARTTSDAEYFAQYAHVQPAMDNDDPSEDHTAIGASTLNGNSVADIPSASTARIGLSNPPPQAVEEERQTSHFLSSMGHPRPVSTSSSGSVDVTRMEDSAASQTHVEITVQQHISTSIKNLFRLARGVGMEQEEFTRVVRTELDTLSMLTESD